MRFENFWRKCIKPDINELVGNFYQYAYESKRGVDDAILHVLINMYANLDKPEAGICLKFWDFSSA